MAIILEGKRIRVDPAQALGKGGEADVYDLGDGRALKLFKPPTHADYQGLPHEAQSARLRLQEHQRKLPDFPRGLPQAVIAPETLAYDDQNSIIGYAMPRVSGATELFHLAQRTFRQGISFDLVRDLFLALHTTVLGIHRAQVVIGDFNDLNVLVVGDKPYLIDADSFQWGPYPARMYTVPFVDPLCCDPQARRLTLMRPHRDDSDWYAYAVMLLRACLFAGPYDGVYLPHDPVKRIPHDERPLRRISLFHAEVRPPKVGVPWAHLPDDLLQVFQRWFEQDERGVFPRQLVEALRFTACTACGAEHFRAQCPVCCKTALLAPRQTITVRGRVTATKIFSSRGTLVRAALEGAELRSVAYAGGVFTREDGSVCLREAWKPGVRIRTKGLTTYVALDGAIRVFTPGQVPDVLLADEGVRGVMFDTNRRHAYWMGQGQLWRDGPYGPFRIGAVFGGKTWLWVGETFGFGFARAGELSYAFVFDAEAAGINDRVPVPRLPGQLVDAWCHLSDERAWFTAHVRHQGREAYHTFVIRRDGTLAASDVHDGQDDHWSCASRGAVAVGGCLLVPTDLGIVRVEAQASSLQVTRTYPDTEPFVSTDVRLLAGPKGLYVVERDSITCLVIV